MMQFSSESTKTNSTAHQLSPVSRRSVDQQAERKEEEEETISGGARTRIVSLEPRQTPGG